MRIQQPLGNVYDKYNTRNPVARKLVRGFLAQMQELLRTLTPCRILDLGCGEGIITEHLAKRFPGVALVASDVDFAFLRRRVARNKTPVVVNALPELCFRTGSFDLVVLVEVLEHLSFPEASLKAIQEISSGHVLISVPHEPLWRLSNMLRLRYLAQLGNTPGHVNHFSAGKFQALLSRHFEIVSLVKPFPWLMALCRVRNDRGSCPG